MKVHFCSVKKPHSCLEAWKIFPNSGKEVLPTFSRLYNLESNDSTPQLSCQF